MWRNVPETWMIGGAVTSAHVTVSDSLVVRQANEPWRA